MPTSNNKFNIALLSLAHDISLIAATLMLVLVASGLALALPSNCGVLMVPMITGMVFYNLGRKRKGGWAALLGSLGMLGAVLVLFVITHNLGMWGG
jgi:4-hydroxybenzoate polyprenyltransferase